LNKGNAPGEGDGERDAYGEDMDMLSSPLRSLNTQDDQLEDVDMGRQVRDTDSSWIEFAKGLNK
jgi:hypothetical protein